MKWNLHIIYFGICTLYLQAFSKIHGTINFKMIFLFLINYQTMNELRKRESTTKLFSAIFFRDNKS